MITPLSQFCLLIHTQHVFCPFLVSLAPVDDPCRPTQCSRPAHWRFLYFHGQRHARLFRDQSVYDKPKRERPIFITLLSPLLFLAPEVRLREMEKLWTDEIIIETLWESFMNKLLEEWEGVILWSSVMLTANVGFLAIPGVVLSNLNGSNLTSASQVLIFTSPSRIASSLSVEASIGSIVIGLLLVLRHRTKHKEDPAGASTYFFLNCHRIFGLEPMAVIFSLPWASLIWSYVVFIASYIVALNSCYEAPAARIGWRYFSSSCCSFVSLSQIHQHVPSSRSCRLLQFSCSDGVFESPGNRPKTRTCGVTTWWC
ncbi:hypothetical protein BC827DRAFT_1129527 [Russula dissimulans]|nr:hypothetical protein BC827DRAFT_1129527 [Russula dissimulans]